MLNSCRAVGTADQCPALLPLSIVLLGGGMGTAQLDNQTAHDAVGVWSLRGPFVLTPDSSENKQCSFKTFKKVTLELKLKLNDKKTLFYTIQ